MLTPRQLSIPYNDDVIKWKHFPRYWPFVRGIHRSPVNSPHKGRWRRALMFCLICVGINGWVNNREAGDLRRHRAHYDVTVIQDCYVDTHAILSSDLFVWLLCFHSSNSVQRGRSSSMAISVMDRIYNIDDTQCLDLTIRSYGAYSSHYSPRFAGIQLAYSCCNNIFFRTIVEDIESWI